MSSPLEQAAAALEALLSQAVPNDLTAGEATALARVRAQARDALDRIRAGQEKVAADGDEYTKGPLWVKNRGSRDAISGSGEDADDALALVYRTAPDKRRQAAPYTGNARRMVACWNYCLGKTTAELEAGIATA